jgi:hypothetical protein
MRAKMAVRIGTSARMKTTLAMSVSTDAPMKAMLATVLVAMTAMPARPAMKGPLPPRTMRTISQLTVMEVKSRSPRATTMAHFSAPASRRSGKSRVNRSPPMRGDEKTEAEQGIRRGRFHDRPIVDLVRTAACDATLMNAPHHTCQPSQVECVHHRQPYPYKKSSAACQF